MSPGSLYAAQQRNGDSKGVTWKVVAISAAVIVLSGGGGWLTYQQNQLNELGRHQENNNKDVTEKLGSQNSDIAVIKERLRVIELNQQEQKENAKEINRKLDDLLNRPRR